MRKNAFTKSVALVICLAFVGLAASGLFAAPKRATYAEVRQILMKQMYSFVSWLPYFEAYKVRQDYSQELNAASSTSKVKPTGDIVIVKPSGRD